MPLITCPDCNAQVSDQAVQCPNCARPMAGSTGTKKGKEETKTIQLTSKKWKLGTALGVLIALAGCFVMVASRDNGGWPLVAVGFGIALVSKIMAWWHHA